MKRKTWGLLALMAVLWGTAGCDQATPPTALDRTDGMEEMSADKRSGDVIPDQYIVVFNDNVKNPRAMAAQLAQEHRAEILHTYEFALSGMAIKAPAAAAEALKRNPNVSYVEADGMVYLDATQSNPTWGIDRIDQRMLPLSKTYTYDYTGENVRAYVIDTGIDPTHPDFGGRVVAGYDAINDGRTGDCNGHGTHVAGTIGSATYGVAKLVALVPVRVLDCNGSGSWTSVIAGVDWVTGQKKGSGNIPMVANMSLGGGVSSSLNNAVTNSISEGVVYAVSAGNSNANACNYSPASTPAALTVGSTTSSDARSSFSNYGTCVDLFAPGSSILSTVPGGGTGTKSGTSMSSPHVAGVAALVLQANPTATAADINQLIVDNATSGVLSSIETGSPNKLLYSLIGEAPPPPPNQPPVANFTVSTSGLTANFTDASTDTDGTIASRSWNFGDDSGTSAATNPSYTYAAGGTYTVSLTVTDNDGATASTSQSVAVTAPALVNVTRIDIQVLQAGRKYYASAMAYAVGGSTISGDFLFKGRYLSTATGIVSGTFATLDSNQTPAKNNDVFTINLTGATGVTTCSVNFSQGIKTCSN